jgi:signal transduction histidine kinase
MSTMDADLRIIEDIQHQLRSPINGAYARVDRIGRILRNEDLPREVMREVAALRGLLGRAQQVMRSAGMFSKLARGEPLPVTTIPLKGDWLVKELVGALMDAEILSDPANDNQFALLNRDAIRDHDVVTIADPDLVDLAIRNLLDNARKYSFARTRVIVEPRLWKKALMVSVRNSGLRLDRNDVANCIQRGWRGAMAMAVTGEGSGIGLWITDEIMRAQGGELRVVPTNTDGDTEFQLVLPKGDANASTSR